MYICAKYLKSEGRLKDDTVVSTVMSNLGFTKRLKRRNQKRSNGSRRPLCRRSDEKDGYNVGGEQSGHLIFLDYNTTGDGLLSAIMLVNTLKASGKTLSELADEMKKFPRLLVNVKVTDKYKVEENAKVKAVISEVEKEMNGDGRILVRPSGTEPLVRVMAEARTKELCDEYVTKIVDVVRTEMGAE
ncbi:hypothetical protein QNN00_02365 [Bacillus velezensis]|nr:hypothetical protein [Bacillus velezensis]